MTSVAPASDHRCADRAGPVPLATARTTLHSAPSLGSLVLPTHPADQAVLLTGEELAGGPPSIDPGWLLGEPLEFSLTRELTGRQTAAHDLARLAQAFLTG